MKISQVIAKISQEFKGLNIENHNLEAGMLLSFVLKKTREYLFAHGEEEVSFLNKLKVRSLIKKRKKEYSLAVLMGEKEFYGRKFFVNKNVLVPRPETENIVSEILNFKFEILKKYKKINIVDVGTGSGCIVVSLVKEIEKELRFKNYDLRFWAIDVSNKALRVACKNAKLHNVDDKIEFIKSDLLKELIDRGEKFDGLTVVTANLPYLTPGQVDSSPTIKKEPRVALIGGDDGLLYYRKLFIQLKKHNRSFPNAQDDKVVVLCEIDESQVDGIGELIGEIIGEKNIKIEIKKDLQGLPRLAIISI